MRIVILHDYACPLGMDGLAAYHEARVALASTPPEAQATERDREALAIAAQELEHAQVCTCSRHFSLEVRI